MDNDTFGGQVIFTFDGDAAGQKAAMRAFGDDQRFVSQTFVAVEPNGLDPCELRQKQGDCGRGALVDKSVPLFEFAIRSVLAGHDLDQPAGRVAALRAAAPVVARIRDRSLAPRVRAIARRLARHGSEARTGRRQPSASIGQAAESATGDRRFAVTRARRDCAAERCRVPNRATEGWLVHASC